jgi:release factor H-coupled RctB family protein
VRQLERTAELPGMRLAVGLPDLHPGRGHPVGAAFLTEGVFHPLLVGNDIGCGMAVFQTELSARKLRLDKWVKRLSALDAPWGGDVEERLERHGVESSWSSGLGTVGGGNHFAELCRVGELRMPDVFHAAGLDEARLQVVVHTGSRGLGEAILRAHVDRHRGEGLTAGSVEADEYLARHDDARRWAKVNRQVVAERFCAATATEGALILDICHNEVERRERGCFLHRKGAAPADRGLVVLPGSRGDESFLLRPTAVAATTDTSAWSLAHGAGRRWKRGECRARLSERYRPDSLRRTRFSSRVVCGDDELLYEEAPQAYKDVGVVVDDLVEHGLVDVVAVLHPVLTFKTAERR